jgi:hypothetical protein
MSEGPNARIRKLAAGALAMSVLTIVDTVLLVLAVIYIVALLRSHADILRRLTALEEGGAGRAPAGAARAASASAAPMEGDELSAASAINGTTLNGDSVMLSFGDGSPVTLLAFLTGGCTSCAPLWAGLRQTPELASLAERVVVVTHDPTRESPARVQRLAPSHAEVIMASAAWDDYAVPSSPHFVLTDGAGGILGRGSALSWPQLVKMVHEARADAAIDVQAVANALAGPESGANGAATSAARTTAERAFRSEQTLARAGIGPGHPSLYPSAASGHDPRHDPEDR